MLLKSKLTERAKGEGPGADDDKLLCWNFGFGNNAADTPGWEALAKVVADFRAADKRF